MAYEDRYGANLATEPGQTDDAVREMLGAQLVQALAKLDAWREVARQGVRLVEYITVTQSTDGQWPKIHAFYEAFDTLHDAEIDAELAEIDAQDVKVAEMARRVSMKNAQRAGRS